VDLKTDLMHVGFTEYETKVYLALLRQNPATGYQLGKSSGVPRSMVYEALGRLHVRGAVLKTDEARATLYRPVPPGVLLDRYEEEHHRLIQRLRESLTSLYDAQDEGHLWTFSGRSAVLSYASEMINAAGSELLLMLADEDLEALRAPIVAACQRGVAVSALLTGQGELSCGRIARHPPQESKLQELTDTLVVVADSHEALIGSTDTEMVATITSSRNLVLIARQFVWMELFAQRLYTQLGPELIRSLPAEDREVFQGFLPLTRQESPMAGGKPPKTATRASRRRKVPPPEA